MQEKIERIFALLVQNVEIFLQDVALFINFFEHWVLCLNLITFLKPVKSIKFDF